MQKIFRKLKIEIDDKIFFITEPSVGDYYLMLEDFENFINKFFPKKLLKIVSEEQLAEILQKIFLEEQNLEVLIYQKQEKQSLNIILSKLVKYFGNSFEDFFKMPFSFFYKILKDFEQIEGEQKQKEELQGLEGLKKLQF